jgi:hypothetical protein
MVEQPRDDNPGTIAPWLVPYYADYNAYWTRRKHETNRLEQQWIADGHASSIAEFARRQDAYEESNKASAERFAMRPSCEWKPELVGFLAEQNRLPDELRLLDAATTDSCVVGYASDPAYTEGQCPRVYRPLRAFFDRNGFANVRRGVSTTYTGSSMCTYHEIGSVEVLGGLSPHGFFAGVYLVEIYD